VTEPKTIPIGISPDFYNAALEWAGVDESIRVSGDPGEVKLVFPTDDLERVCSELINAIVVRWVESWV
jgi:hypothetical protein